jgi:serine/threonine protein kinase
MKYVPNSVTLRSQLDGTPWPVDRVTHVIDQVAEALHAAHEAGVVHRDVKPSNVLVTPDSRHMVFDFGIAKPLRRVNEPTGEGFVVGTPEFMSPEQCRGDKIDHRTDIYSLGVMTYQMLAGRVPFTAETPVGVLMKHLTAPLPIPLEEVELTVDLNQVLARAMARSAEDRFHTVREFKQAFLSAAGDGQTVTIVASTLRQPSWKRWVYRVKDTPRKMLALAGSAALAMGLGGVVLGYHLFSSDGANAPVVETSLPPAESSETTEAEGASKPLPADEPRTSKATPTPNRARDHHSLEQGFLHIKSNRPAVVSLDGKRIGNAPGDFGSLPPGPHQLQLDAGGGRVWEKEIVIFASQTTYVEKNFTPLQGLSEPVPTASTNLEPKQLKAMQKNAPPSRARTPSPSDPTSTRRWEGFLTDEQCREVGGQQGALHLESALRCIKEGKRPMLYTKEGKLYYLDGFEKIELVEDAPLVFWGWLDGETNTIHVTTKR